MDERSIVRVLEALGTRKIKSGPGKISASCPLAPYKHKDGSDNNPSFSMEINPAGPSRFYCFSCKLSGKKSISLLYAWKDATGQWRNDLADLIHEQEGGSPFERNRKLGDYFSRKRQAMGVPQQTSNWRVEGYEGKFDAGDYTEILKTLPQYALTRGIDGTQARRWGIGFDQADQRLFFSIFDESGRMVGFSRRAIREDQTPKYLHAEYFRRDRYLYGEQFLDRSLSYGFLMEGFMDVLNLDRLGWRNVLACFGTAVSERHIEKMKKWFDRVVILPHNDAKPENESELAAGQRMAKDYAARLQEAGLKVAIGPVIKGKKDPGEWTPAEAAQVYQRLKGFIEHATPGADAEKSGRQEGSPREAQGAPGGTLPDAPSDPSGPRP